MRFLLLITAMILYSCNTEKKLLSSWIGSTKEQIIQAWGPPERTDSNGANGEVLTWSYPSYNAFNGIATYHNRMMYVNERGSIYYWRYNNTQTPPSAIIVH